MKRLPLIFSLLFAGFVASTLLSTPAFAEAQSLNGVVAIVNNSVITQTEFNTALDAAKHQLAASQTPNAIDDSKLKKMVLQQLIDEKLQLELAERAKLTVTDAQVTAAIKHIADGNHLTVAQLQQALQQQGMSYPAYRKMIHKQLLLHQVQEGAVASQIHISDADLQDARAQLKAQMGAQQQAYHVIDIVEPTKEAAQKIAVELKDGKKLNDIAPKNATDLGWQTANTLPTLFVNQISKMQTGDIAGPIEAPNGFHVLQLIGVHGPSSTPPTKQQLQNIAYQIQSQKAVAKWMKEVRKTAYIKITAP